MFLWDELNKELDKRIGDIKDSLAYGNAANYDEYRHAVGLLEGLSFTKDVLKNIYNARIHEEEQ
jgi:hypothetical protein